jgi:hypothetical protein
VREPFYQNNRNSTFNSQIANKLNLIYEIEGRKESKTDIMERIIENAK